MFFFYLFDLCFCALKLKFQREFNYENNFTIDDFFMNKIYTNISIGTPSQIIKSYINCKEFFTFFSGNQSNIKFNYNNSNSFISDYKLEYFSMKYFSYGYNSYDNFIFDGENETKYIQNFSFILAMKGPLNDNISIPGIIGLKMYDNTFKYKYNNIINQLKKKNIILSYAFSINYNKDSDSEGNIIIGEYEDKNQYILNFEFSRTEYNDYEYRLILENITYSNYTIESNLITEFDLNINNIVGSIQLKDILKQSFFGELIEKKLCNESLYMSYRMIYIQCKDNIDITKFKTIYLKFNGLGKVFELNYNDLFKKHGNLYYFLMTFDTKIPYKVCLGVPFLKKYQFIFDQDKKIIGYYKDTIKGNKFHITYILIFILFIILLFLCLFYYKIFYKIQRKTRFNELEEDFDYTPKLILKNI